MALRFVLLAIGLQCVYADPLQTLKVEQTSKSLITRTPNLVGYGPWTTIPCPPLGDDALSPYSLEGAANAWNAVNTSGKSGGIVLFWIKLSRNLQERLQNS